VRTVLYSAIYGGFDQVPPLRDTPGVDRVMFTDDPNLEAQGWDVRVEPAPDVHPRMAAKRYKLQPHAVLPEYDRRVWMDGSHTLLNPDAVTVALDLAAEPGIALHKHPERDCIYDEALASIAFATKYGDQPIAEQTDAYRAEGHPPNWGLWAAGTVASHRHADAIFDAWWDEVNRWSYQDQLSLPVVLRRAGVRPGEFPHSQYASPWFEVGGHSRDD